MAHSKRNTALAFFTSHERTLLRHSWGSQSTRLTRDSFLPFASCALCLLPARDPVACPSASKADIFCRECALNDLMAQLKEIKRMEKERSRLDGERVEEVRRGEEAEKVREVERFEMVAQGLERDGTDAGRGHKKRKLDTLGDGEDLGRQKVKTEEKKTEASFWVPGVDVSSSKKAKPAEEKPAKIHPICSGSTPTTKHTYSFKSLISIHFSEEKTDKKTSNSNQTLAKICPACQKSLSNSSKAILAKPCGHVLCGSCVDKFMRPPDTHDPHDPDGKEKHGTILCYVCETIVTETEPRDKTGKRKDEGKGEKGSVKRGLVEINCEGTGFAGGGKNIAKREGVSYQC